HRAGRRRREQDHDGEGRRRVTRGVTPRDDRARGAHVSNASQGRAPNAPGGVAPRAASVAARHGALPPRGPPRRAPPGPGAAPGGAKTKTGKPRSIMAIGPCRKSAPENLSATT